MNTISNIAYLLLNLSIILMAGAGGAFITLTFLRDQPRDTAYLLFILAALFAGRLIDRMVP